jgi:hypothetical protein
MTVDSYRFVDRITRRVLKGWAARESYQEIPWTPLPRSLAECTVALVSTAGLALETDEPFDQEGERRNPWWGDPSFRVIPRDAAEKNVRSWHLHGNAANVKEDLGCVLPLAGLLELEAGGEIGRSAPRHYSFMGYILEPAELLDKSTPEMIRLMKEDAVDAALLVPY